MYEVQSDKFDSWYKLRGYIHFDYKVSKKFAQSYITNPEKVESHPFLPFLKYIKSTPRYKSIENKTIHKERPILYASHLDSHIYSWYARQLRESYEEFIAKHALSNCVLAYRALGKCNIDFAKDVFNEVEQRESCTALAFDLSSFFDSIDHAKLKSAWCEVLGSEQLPKDHYKIYRSITKYAYLDRNTVFKELKIDNYKEVEKQGRICSSKEFRERLRAKIKTNHNSYGIPQGSPISAILSNIFLIDFDRIMSKYALEVDGIYRRYCDDILWICPSEKTEEIKNLVQEEIKKCGDSLLPNPEKTEVSEFRRTTGGLLIGSPPLQYLGFTFDGQNRLLRSQTMSRYHRRMKRAVHSAGRAAFQAQDCKIHCQELYEQYSHLGQRNFIKYALRASENMGSQKIRRQVRNHWKQLHKEIAQVETQLKTRLED